MDTKLKTRPIPVRFTELDFEMIDQAASILGENRAEFLRQSAKIRAKKVLKKNKEILALGGEANAQQSAVARHL